MNYNQKYYDLAKYKNYSTIQYNHFQNTNYKFIFYLLNS